jgi:D-erythrulose 1-phosphate 3-epimerase
MSFRLGIDLGFARGRYQEPEVWTKIVGQDLRLGFVSIIADILNPLWPKEYLDQLIKRTQTGLHRYGIQAETCFTSALTRVPHFLSSDAEMRAYYLQWFKDFFALGARLGCRAGGSNFGIMSFLDYNDESRRSYIFDEAVSCWQRLSCFAADLGFTCLMFEPMSVPREMGNTVAECRDIMDRVNANAAIPMKLCLDIGHAPHPDERDPYPWIEQLGALSPMIHLQQTVLHRSNHSPFTEEFNRTGIIRPAKVMEALRKSGAKDALLAFEISHREHFDTDFRVIQDLKESAAYWRPYIEDEWTGPQ